MYPKGSLSSALSLLATHHCSDTCKCTLFMSYSAAACMQMLKIENIKSKTGLGNEHPETKIYIPHFTNVIVHFLAECIDVVQCS